MSKSERRSGRSIARINYAELHSRGSTDSAIENSMPSDKEGVVKNVDMPAGDAKSLASETETGTDDEELAKLLKEEQEEREKAKKLAKKKELCEARERVRRLREEKVKLKTQLSLRERQADRKFTSAATGSDWGRNDGQNGIAYSKSVGEDINAVRNLISDQFRLPVCTPNGAGARGRYSVRRRIWIRRASSLWHAGIAGVSTVKTDKTLLKINTRGLRTNVRRSL